MTHPAEEPAPADEADDPGFTPPEMPGTGAPMSEDDALGTPPDPDVVLEDAPEEPEVTELTDDERRQFSRLLQVGKITKRVEIMGFSVVISSLNCDDEIRVFRACSPDQGTAAYPRAYSTALVAAAVQTADNVNWGASMAQFPDPDAVYQDKLVKARELHWLVVEAIYDEILKMNAEFAELARKLGKRRG